MFNFHNRHYIFRQSNGEIRDIFCDQRQNLCCGTLSMDGSWSDAVILAKNVHQYIYAELGQDNTYYILYQDNSGNIGCIIMDGQSVKTIPILNSKTPYVYNKQLYIAPLQKDIYLFYVLQHDNSFMLAYQLMRDGRAGTPKIVDYVSGSSIPCSLLYDSDMNIYAFYQSYDGKYLQLGYKKFNSAQRHWSDFTPVTKYSGNCEYPHAVIDSSGTIHLCYQRRAPKLFEMVYQCKTPDRNFWSAETVLHSSVHPFENASILQADDMITVYWIRDDIIYCTMSPLGGGGWSKPARYGTQPGRLLQCICYKDLLRRSSFGSGRHTGDTRDGSAFGDGSALRDGSSNQRSGDSSVLSPGIYPGTVSNGFRLAFSNAGSARTPLSAQLAPAAIGSASGDELKKLILNVFRQIQDNISELSAGWTETKNELSRLMNAYSAMSKEISKYSIRLNMLENKLRQMDNSLHRTGTDEANMSGEVLINIPREYQTAADGPAAGANKAASAPVKATSGPADKQGTPYAGRFEKNGRTAEEPGIDAAVEKKAAPSLDPEAMKMWEEWKEPKEWIEGG